MSPWVENVIFRTGGFLVPLFSLILSLPYLVLAILFFDNFSFGDLTHLAFFGMSVAGPALAIGSAVLFQFKPLRWTFLLTVSSLILVAVSWAAWLTVMPRGIIH